MKLNLNEDSLENFGCNEINILINKFGQGLIGSNSLILNNIFKSGQLKIEWESSKPEILTNYVDRKERIKDFLFMYKDTYTELYKLNAISLTPPISNAEC